MAYLLWRVLIVKVFTTHGMYVDTSIGVIWKRTWTKSNLINVIKRSAPFGFEFFATFLDYYIIFIETLNLYVSYLFYSYYSYQAEFINFLIYCEFYTFRFSATLKYSENFSLFFLKNDDGIILCFRRCKNISIVSGSISADVFASSDGFLKGYTLSISFWGSN